MRFVHLWLWLALAMAWWPGGGRGARVRLREVPARAQASWRLEQASTVGAGWGHALGVPRRLPGFCERARQEFLRTFRVSDGLLGVVLGFLPTRCYLVAAKVGAFQGSDEDLAYLLELKPHAFASASGSHYSLGPEKAPSPGVVVWEMVVSDIGPHGPSSFAELVREIAAPVGHMDWKAAVDCVYLLPRSEILVADVLFYNTWSRQGYRGVIWWDARTGDEWSRLFLTRVADVSPRGDFVVLLTRREDSTQAASVWHIDADGRPWQAASLELGPESSRSVHEVAIAPDGSSMAALVSRVLLRTHWSVEIWNVTTNQRSCGVDLDLDLRTFSGPKVFSFDGRRGVLCQGFGGARSVVEFRVAPGEFGCRAAAAYWPSVGCEDAFLPTGVLLNVDSRGTATVTTIDGAVLAKAASQARYSIEMGAKFAPDGRAVVLSCLDQGCTWVWNFKDEKSRFVPTDDYVPTFSSDGAFLAGSVDGRSVGIWDAFGRLVQWLQADVTSGERVVVASARGF